jgi:hypothetical protein
VIVVGNATGSKLQIVTSAAGAIEVGGSYVDRNESADTSIADDINLPQITTATTTDILTAAAAGHKFNVKGLIIRNVHATVTNIVTVKHTDGTNSVTFFPCTLLPGEGLHINDAGVPFVYDATGAVKAGAGTGRLLRTVVLTAGTTYTTGAGTNQIFARLQGGGGGGAGCTSVASAASGGGGGGGGSYAEKTFAVTPNTQYTIAIGAAGTGVSAAAGNNGGNTTLTVGGVTVTAPGGSGAPVATALTTLSAYVGGQPGAISTNGDVNTGGAPGQGGVVVVVATPVGFGGGGGSSNFGSGGGGRSTVGNGNAGIGFGAGGGGALTGASVARTGGNGTAGIIIIDEYA